MKIKPENHTFVICAYKESPYLEECIRSLKNQSVRTNLRMAASTDNGHIRALAEKYGIPLDINPGPGGITQDWNFAYSRAGTSLITLAHQDDVYCKDYAKEILACAARAKRPLILFSDYGEIRNGARVRENMLLKIKRMMLIPLEFGALSGSRFVRRRMLSFGNPISCPAVTYARENLPEPVFLDGYTCVEDWQAWERISRLKGQFIYCKKLLMYHRIHEESTTSGMIGDTGRGAEDLEMFEKFWPKPIARLIGRLYSVSERSNRL